MADGVMGPFSPADVSEAPVIGTRVNACTIYVAESHFTEYFHMCVLNQYQLLKSGNLAQK